MCCGSLVVAHITQSGASPGIDVCIFVNGHTGERGLEFPMLMRIWANVTPQYEVGWHMPADEKQRDGSTGRGTRGNALLGDSVLPALAPKPTLQVRGEWALTNVVPIETQLSCLQAQIAA